MLRIVASRVAVRHLCRSNRFSPPCLQLQVLGQRYLSSKEPSSFSDVINKMKNKPSDEKNNDESKGDETSDKQEQEPKKEEVDYASLASKAFAATKKASSSFVTGLKGAWQELITPQQKSKIRVPVVQAKPSEVDENYDGPTAMVLVDQPKSVWEAMQDRLGSSPLIREVLKNTRKFQEAAAETDVGKTAKKVSDSFRNKIEDAREVWETSQNPLIYSLSSVVDTLTSHTEESLAIKAIQNVEKEFDKEDWAKDVLNNLAPKIMKAHLEGDLTTLRTWLGEACYNRLKADIQTRKYDGIIVDPNILDIQEHTVVFKYGPSINFPSNFNRVLEGEGPIIIATYFTQQINHITKKDGTVIEGGPNNIIARSYSLVYKPVYEEPTETEPGYIVWKVIEYEMGPPQAYY